MVRPPPEELLLRWPTLYRGLVERVLYGLGADPQAIITSWFRDRASNAAAGGAQFSQHRLGFALDIVPSQPERELHLALRLQDAGLVVVREGSHIHVQAFTAGTIPPGLFVY